MLVLLRGQYEVVLAFAFANVSALTAFGSLPFGKATHASVVLRSMLGFLRTCVRLYADASKSATDRVPKNVFEENFLGCSHRAFIPFFILLDLMFYISNIFIGFLNIYNILF